MNVYDTASVSSKLGVTSQMIRKHAKRYNIGTVLPNGYRIFYENDISELEKHVGYRGNPSQETLYKQWPKEKFQRFVKLNKRQGNGYTYEPYENTAGYLAKIFEVSVGSINGLRRKYRLAHRYLMGEYGEASDDRIADLIYSKTESDLRKRARQYPPLD